MGSKLCTAPKPPRQQNRSYLFYIVERRYILQTQGRSSRASSPPWCSNAPWSPTPSICIPQEISRACSRQPGFVAKQAPSNYPTARRGRNGGTGTRQRLKNEESAKTSPAPFSVHTAGPEDALPPESFPASPAANTDIPHERMPRVTLGL